MYVWQCHPQEREIQRLEKLGEWMGYWKWIVVSIIVSWKVLLIGKTSFWNFDWTGIWNL